MIAPKNIQSIGNEIAVAWEDGVEAYYPMELLRAVSPSAENVGERDLLGQIHGGSSQTEFPGVTVTGWNLVGGYAIQFLFSDKHHTGLYSFEYLRKLWDDHLSDHPSN
jgi:DUF971 family protein